MTRYLRTTVPAMLRAASVLLDAPGPAGPPVAAGPAARCAEAGLISAQDLEAARSRRSPHGDRTLAGRLALRLLLAQTLGVPPVRAGSLPVDRACARCGRPHGAPRHPRRALSSSTSGTQVLAAVGPGGSPLGVDVQEPPEALWTGFDEVVRHPSEHPSEGAPPAAARSARHAGAALWARKEAVLKAAGTGLDLAPHTVPLRPCAGHAGRWTVAEDAPGAVRGLVVQDLSGPVPAAIARGRGAGPVEEVPLDRVLGGR